MSSLEKMGIENASAELIKDAQEHAQHEDVRLEKIESEIEHAQVKISELISERGNFFRKLMSKFDEKEMDEIESLDEDLAAGDMTLEEVPEKYQHVMALFQRVQKGIDQYYKTISQKEEEKDLIENEVPELKHLEDGEPQYSEDGRLII